MAGRETPAPKAGIAFQVLEHEHDAKSESYGLEAAETIFVSAGRAPLTRG
jgi:hypothetical protein